ncbi:MAG: glucose-1-phosphate cytidylyltransferase [Burkholderiales bacterium]
MKVVILAGGFGTRISEESHLKPKPMIDIGGRPVLWHVMKIFSAHGLNDFIICCGYKGYLIKEYFANYFLHMSDVTFDMRNNRMQVHENSAEPWKVTLVDTGERTMTGGRLRRVRKYLGDEPFCFTYGDGLANVDVTKLIAFHGSQNTLATVTAVQPPGRFGALNFQTNKICDFEEKPSGDRGWVSGGFFVLSPQAFDYIGGDDTSWELEPLKTIARAGQLSAFVHSGFWQPMDTMRDRSLLEELWASGEAPWKVWV